MGGRSRQELGQATGRTIRTVVLSELWDAEERLAEAALFSTCWSIYVTGAFRPAAQCWAHTFYRSFPDSDRLDAALFLAADAYGQQRAVGKAITLWKGLLLLRPDSPLAGPSLLAIARSYDSIAVYSESAKFYELYAIYFSHTPEAPRGLLKAAIQRRAVGDLDEAKVDVDRMRREFPDDHNLPHAESLARLLEHDLPHREVLPGARGIVQ